MADERKRVSLPVIGAGARRTALEEARLGDEQGSERASASWTLLGALAIVLVLVPLSLVALAVHGWLGGAATAIGAVLAVALAAFGGGMLIGHFGPRIGTTHGAIAGALAGGALWAMSRAWLGVAIVAVAAPLAALGAWRGRRARPGRAGPTAKDR